MNLIVCSRDAIFWVIRVFWQFLRKRPATSIGLICSSICERITLLLAFFLPLKVIILAGTDGVPRYFRFFIEQDQRMEWIIGLSIASVVFFILSFVFAAWSRRLSTAGSMEVLQGANEIAITSTQREEARSYYSQFSGIMAGFVLAILAFLVLYLVDNRVFYAIFGLVVFQYMVSFAFLRFGDVLNPRGVLKIILRNLGGYLKFFANVNFLAGFFVVLIPYVFLEYDGNILFAILAILLMRQAMGALSGSITSTAELWSNRLNIEPMVFRHVTSQRGEKSVSRDLRLVFEKQRRENLLREHLVDSVSDGISLTSQFRDVPYRMFYTFLVTICDVADTRERIVQAQVFSDRQLRLLEHETFLFEYLDRHKLFAPLVAGRFEDGPFVCQLVEAGFGKAVPASKWKQVSTHLLEYLWSLELPPALASAYSTGNVSLAGRLTEAHVKRVSVSLDTTEQREIYMAFLGCFERVVNIVANVPLCIFNADMAKRENVFQFPEDEFRVMYWQRWAIDHVGAFVPVTMSDDELASVLSRVIKARKIKEDALSVAHVRLVALFHGLEGLIHREQYNAGIRQMGFLLENKLVAEIV